MKSTTSNGVHNRVKKYSGVETIRLHTENKGEKPNIVK